MLRVDEIRADFPILGTRLFGRPLVYLDNAATMQVPEPVLQAIMRHYHEDNANVHRGIHALSERSTRALEEAREHVASFINACSADEVVFTSGTTASLNMLAEMLVARMKPGQAVVTTVMEHHANFVPWQQACGRTGHPFLVAPLDERGDLDLRALEAILEQNDVGVVAVTQVSNVLGTVKLNGAGFAKNGVSYSLKAAKDKISLVLAAKAGKMLKGTSKGETLSGTADSDVFFGGAVRIGPVRVFRRFVRFGPVRAFRRFA